MKTGFSFREVTISPRVEGAYGARLLFPEAFLSFLACIAASRMRNSSSKPSYAFLNPGRFIHSAINCSCVFFAGSHIVLCNLLHSFFSQVGNTIGNFIGKLSSFNEVSYGY